MTTKNTLAARLEALGNESIYKEQAALFLKETGADISIRKAVPQRSPEWAREIGQSTDYKGPKKYEHGIHYSVTISKDLNHSYTFDYWGSIADAEKAKQWPPKRVTPSAYDILCCLHDGDGIENYGDFCANYGYDEDSRTAYRTYEAVKEQKEAMQKIFTPEELESLTYIR